MDHFKTYKDFLLENSTEPEYLYHGTKHIRLDGILKNGLGSGQRDTDTLYVTSSLEDAEYYSSRKGNGQPAILRIKNSGMFDRVLGKIDEYKANTVIRPDDLEVRKGNGEWVKLKDYKHGHVYEYQKQDISLLESLDDYFTIGFEIEIEDAHFVPKNESVKLSMSRKETKKVTNFEHNFINFITKYGNVIEYHYDETLNEGLEIVSNPFSSLKEAKNFIKLFFEDFEDQEDWMFNSKTSIHVNVGTKGKKWNVVKGLMMMSDDYTFTDIESRKYSQYCKSLKKEISDILSPKYGNVDNIKYSISEFEKKIYETLSLLISDDFSSHNTNKEWGINISKVLYNYADYVEYRHIGNMGITDDLVLNKLMYYCYITYLMTSDYKQREYYKKLSSFFSVITKKNMDDIEFMKKQRHIGRVIYQDLPQRLKNQYKDKPRLP